MTALFSAFAVNGKQRNRVEAGKGYVVKNFVSFV